MSAGFHVSDTWSPRDWQRLAEWHVDVASGDLTDPAPDSTPCDDPTTDPQALEGLILEKSKDQEDAMGGAVQAEQEAEQHSVIMRVAIFTWGIHGGPAQEVTFSLL